MKWQPHTEYTLSRLFKDETYEGWTKAVKDGEISEFDGTLDELLSRLSGVAASEFEMDDSDKAKVLKLMELAALAGKRL